MEKKEVNVNTENQASEYEKLALEAFMEVNVPAAKEKFLKDGILHPVVFIITETDGKIGMGIMPVNEFMRSTSTKDVLSDLMKGIGERVQPVAISMVMEAWMKQLEPIEGETKEEAVRRGTEIPPSESPDRKECIMCTFESENIQKTVTFEIIREPELKLVPYHEMDQMTGMEGRFVNILRDMKKVRNN